MKKLLALALILIMCMGSLAACGTTEQPAEPTTAPTQAPTTAPTQAPVEETVSDLVNAKNYLFTMYKDQTVSTPVDYTVVGVVNIGGVLFPIEWTVDNDTVKIIPGDDKMVTIDVDDKNPEEVTYVLTATLKDDKGNTESCSFKHKVPAAIILDEGMTYADIVDAAYTLEDGLAMDGTFRLYGTITKIDTAWSPDYKNITVTIAIAGKEDKPIMCYRLAGEGAENLAVGDAITVEGTLKNYKGTIEFDAGCVLVGYGEHKDYTALLDAAYTLEDGLAMTDPCTMSGVITKIDTPYSADYKNITVIMVVNGVEDKPIMCYRLQGEGCENLAVGDYITVTGIIKNYKGTIEFDAKCNLDNVVKAAGSATEEPVEEPVEVAPVISAADLFDAAKVIETATNMADDATFAAVLQGTVASIDTEYSEQYGNLSVTINVAGTDKTLYCYRLKGEGAATLAVGDAVTIVGTIAKYKGAPQFGAGCLLLPAEEFESVQAAVAGYALANGESIENKTITGVVAEVKTAYSEQYGNVTVTLVPAGLDAYIIECFRMKGDVAATVAVGDVITVTGKLLNYNGKIEFDAGCIGTAVAAEETPVEEEPVVEEPVVEEPVVEEPVVEEPVSTDLVINFADLTAGGYGYEASVNGGAVDVSITTQYQEIQYILPETIDLAAYSKLIVDVESNYQLDIKLVDPNAETNQYGGLTPFRDNYTGTGPSDPITAPVEIDLTAYADKDLYQIGFMACNNNVVFTIKSITFVK